MKKLIVLLSVVVVLAVATVAHGTVLNYTVYPGDLADGVAFANGQGGEPFGYDHGPVPPQGPPIGVYVPGPLGYGQSSWWSDVQGSAAGGPRDYTSFRMSPKDIFGVSDVTVGDLDDFSYWTKHIAGLDWRFTIYTETLSGQIGGWYGHRIQYNYPNNPDANWTLQTKAGLGINNVKAGGDAGLLSDTENIMFIDVLASYMTNSPPSDSYLDGVELVLANGDIAKMDLAVPEPLTMLGLFMGLGGVGAYIRKRRMS